jgi:hypothetical protein
VFGVAATALVLGILTACGGGAPQRDPGWEAAQRLPDLAPHWWWDPLERHCEEDDDCGQGGNCRSVRLGTCSNCPPGENVMMCVGGEEEDIELIEGRNRDPREEEDDDDAD